MWLDLLLPRREQKAYKIMAPMSNVTTPEMTRKRRRSAQGQKPRTYLEDTPHSLQSRQQPTAG